MKGAIRMSKAIPFPPAPEPGWYADDPVDTQSATQPATQPTTQPATRSGDGGWDDTVLSGRSGAGPDHQEHRTYTLHNEATGQTIVLDRSVLLGRRPSEAIPEGSKAVRIEDPTRTISRNHAAISIDQDGRLWIEDYGSLNGTFIIRDGEERQVVEGTPMPLEAPATLRVGDQFLTLEEQR